MPETVYPSMELFGVDIDNDFLMTPENFLAFHGYKSAGEYLNYCLENADAERDYGTLAMCYNECPVLAGKDKCEHGCPSAALYFEMAEGGE